MPCGLCSWENEPVLASQSSSQPPRARSLLATACRGPKMDPCALCSQGACS